MSTHIRYLVLYILLPYPSRYITKLFLSKILPLPSWFTLQPMPAPEQWFTTYNTDTNTNVLLDYLSHNTPLNQLIFAKLVLTYHKTIAQNLLCLLNSILIYLKLVTVSTNHIYRIIFFLSLRRVILIWHTLHLSLVIWENKKHFTVWKYGSFGHVWDQISRIGWNNVYIIYSPTSGENATRKWYSHG